MYWKFSMIYHLKKHFCSVWHLEKLYLVFICMFKFLKCSIAPSAQKFHYENQPNPHCSSSFMVTISFLVYNFIGYNGIGDNFWTLVTEFRYWWHLWKPQDSHTCYQHISSPTSVTNIVVATLLALCSLFS